VLTRALDRIPPALEVLVAERPRLTAALQKLGDFSSLASGLVNDTQADLVRNLRNLEPTLRALADVGPNLDKALAYFTAFPYGQSTIDRAIRGDYLNQYIIFDFTVPRLKKTLFLGTSWGQEGAKLVPAPGDPWYATYTYDPLHVPFSPPPAAVAGVGPMDDPVAATPVGTRAPMPLGPPEPVPAAALPGPGAVEMPPMPGMGPLPGPAPDQGGN
jgi:ABC-type transporter Mla subunit MlaD